ncbi:DUF4272 domain-containing protein [Acinetobacter sp. WCHAc060033]|uniref:DUF4272 domain-containing protein n=1 Tax=Acinetobacter sp. WCHAc060033 TaxID=2518624 RepID=UPI0010236F18|nr:DUF4272 domain-containing protein [Acinetobacter sp. WCHAc060033]RZG78755.1 DUF4272 domain-containing protein [Acinetobacter sp. WCHAc060033]
MKTPQQRKEQSIEILKHRDIPYIDWLPMIESVEDVEVRTAESIAQRAIACLWVIQVACDIDNGKYNDEIKDFVLNVLAKMQVMDALTENEKAILHEDVSQQDVINMVWKYEAYWVLLWALGIVEELNYPENIVDCDFAIQAVVSAKTFEEFMAKVKLRDIEEILDQADLIYRYDWACVNARLKQEQAPAQLNSAVVVERHGALNWLIQSDSDWDHPDVST